MSGPAAPGPAVLVSTSSFPRWEGDTDPRFIEELCFELASAYDVTVLAPRCPGAAAQEQLVRDGRLVKVRRYGYFLRSFETLAYGGGIAAKIRRQPLRGLLVPFLLAGQLLALHAHIRRQRVDVLHAHWVIPQGLISALYRRFARRPPPLLLTVHGSDLTMLRRPVFERLASRILRSADRVSTVSSALRDEVLELGCAQQQVVVRSMGVDLRNRFTPGGAGRRSGIITVGKLAPGKGTRFLLQAFARLAAEFPGLTLTVIGDGSEREALERLAADLGIREQVTFTGALPQADIPNHLRAASIAVMPSLAEGLGLAAVEAMGCGCAMVASDLPALRDVITPGESGLLAAPGDPVDLEQAMRKLLEDEAGRQRIAETGREAVLQRFDWSVVGKAYRELIKDLCR